MRENGRSMVEMLGVLAIIGVLSVGAIAGYSKAMMKYKLNKQSEQLSTILNNFMMYVHDFKFDDLTYMTDILTKLNAIPLEMIKDGKDQNFVYDALNNQYVLSCHISQGTYFCSVYIGMDTSNYSVESCRNIVTTVKENAADLWQILMYKNMGNDIVNRTYGDKYCNGSNVPCIRYMKLADIENFCRSCTVEDSCHLTIHMR